MARRCPNLIISCSRCHAVLAPELSWDSYEGDMIANFEPCRVCAVAALRELAASIDVNLLSLLDFAPSKAKSE